jgi:hypothetical protein
MSVKIARQIASPKSGRLRYVPLTTRLAGALQDHRHLRGPLVLYQDDGSPLTEGVVQGFVRRAAQRAGLNNNGPHAASNVLLTFGDAWCAGASDSGIGRASGSDDDTAYMHLSLAALDGAIRLLECPGIPRSFGDMFETAGPENREVQSVEQFNWRRERDSNPRQRVSLTC